MKTICKGFRKCGIFPVSPSGIDISLLNTSQLVPGASDLQTDRTNTGGEALAIDEPGPTIAKQPDRVIPGLPQEVGEESPCPPVMALNA